MLSPPASQQNTAANGGLSGVGPIYRSNALSLDMIVARQRADINSMKGTSSGTQINEIHPFISWVTSHITVLLLT